jgi:hypothetical protein
MSTNMGLSSLRQAGAGKFAEISQSRTAVET